MRLEAIAALLGHRSMEMTLTYARIADRVVADEYASVHAHIDALYGQIPSGALPADVETAAMSRLRHEAHARMLGNGLCTRPAELDYRMETICETCAYFATGPEFIPVLFRQRDHARERHQTDRADLFDALIERGVCQIVGVTGLADPPIGEMVLAAGANSRRERIVPDLVRARHPEAA